MFNIIEQSGAIQKMRSELTNAGVKELRTAEEVNNVLKNLQGTSAVFINSVCGCAAGSARPGFVKSLENENKPKTVYTVFAGQDKEATEQARNFFTNQPPSSPAIAFFKDGEFIGMVHRHQIEGTSAEELASGLKDLYNRYFK